MGKIITRGIYTIIAISGILQFLLLPGLIWNLTFPFLHIFLVLLTLKFFRKNKFIKYCTLIIGLIFIVDISFSVYSSFNIHPNNVDKEIKVMSYNLFFKNKSPVQSISVIKKVNPDVLVVQELTPSWAAKLDESIGKRYNFKLIKPLRGTHGIGIYSKFKIDNQRFLDNSYGKPYAQIVDVSIQGKKLQLINTHLASPAVAVENKEQFIPYFLNNYQVRKGQIKTLNDMASIEEHKYNCQLLLGDLNTLYSEPIFKSLKFKWVNASSGLLRWMNFNFPNSSRVIPIVTLDYVMGRGELKFLGSKVIQGGSSDHLAIVSEIKI